MSDKKTVTARLDIEIFVECPNEDCGSLINLLDERDTDGTAHDDEGYLIRAVFSNDAYENFECEDVVCSKCKTEFNVKELEW